MVMRLIFPYAATTDSRVGPVTVRVAPRYLVDQSDDASGRHVWSYHVRIENGGSAPVQLVSRHWVITDGNGRIETVAGPGVIGQQPFIAPGQAFDYMSGCPLPTPSGTMHGHYAMMSEAGGFDAEIPAFALQHPHLKPSVN
jgi:ApaG protein